MGSAWPSAHLECRAPMVSTAERGLEVPVAVRAAPTEIPETKNVVDHLCAANRGLAKIAEWLVTDFEAGSRKEQLCANQLLAAHERVKGFGAFACEFQRAYAAWLPADVFFDSLGTHALRSASVHASCTRRAAVRTFGPGFMDRSRVSCPSTCGEHSGDAGVQGQGKDRTREMQSGSGARGLSRRAIKWCARGTARYANGANGVG